MYNNNFWYNNIDILWKDDNWKIIIPSSNMGLNEKLNALVRLSILIGVIQWMLSYNSKFLYIPIICAILSILIHENKNISEKFTNNNEIDTVKPTKDNPLMNYNIITDFPKRNPAEKSYNNPKIKDNIKEKFNNNLYRDVSDLYGKNNSQRQFYTMPSTTNPNNQTAFAKWCFDTGPTCKEDTIKCVNNWPLK